MLRVFTYFYIFIDVFSGLLEGRIWRSAQPTGNFVGQLLYAGSYDISYGQ